MYIVIILLYYFFSTDELDDVSVLNSSFCQHVLSGVTYSRDASNNLNDSLLLKEACQQIDTLNAELEWILSLNHSKFWCQVSNEDQKFGLLNKYRLSQGNSKIK